jgi:hypothetical protein
MAIHINYTTLGTGLKFDHIMVKAANQFGASLENENERRIMKKKRGDRLIPDTLLILRKCGK